jgi:hypothetical protein
MKIKVYPADTSGCGHFRLIWPVQALLQSGEAGGLPSDVEIEMRPPTDRDLKMRVDGDHVHDVLDIEPGSVYVFQRLTHRWMAEAVPIIRSKGAAVVIDIDDDLSSIHPRNPAYDTYHPRNEGAWDRERREVNRHSWANLQRACREATLVTVSTPALLNRYAAHGRGQVLFNYLPDIYYGVPHEDSPVVGWPASLHSHPDDPSALGGALARLTAAGTAFRVTGDPTGVGAAFGLREDPSGASGPITVDRWPTAVAELGVGIAPLADTRFNACKSWLKPLEMSALGVPWVASPRAEYERLHRRGAGVLADTPRRWHREIERLVSSPGLRAERAEAGREVAAGLMLRDHAWRWLEAWSRASDLQKGQAVTRGGRAASRASAAS